MYAQKSFAADQTFVLSPFEDFSSDQLFDSISKHSSSSLLIPSPVLSPFLMATPPTSPSQAQKFDHYFSNVLNDNSNVNQVMSGAEFLSPLMDLNEVSDNFLREGWHGSDQQQEEEEDHSPKLTLTVPRVQINDEIIAKKIEKATTKTTTTSKKKTATTTTTRKKKSAVDNIPVAQNLERGWTTVFVDKQFENQIDVSLSSKTRCEEPSAEVPSKMYSSLKYEIRQHAVGPLCDKVQFILSKITVVDSVTFEEIKKDTKPVLKGVVEAALTKPPGVDSVSKLYGVLKSQFTDVSYHHKRRDFCWQISLFRPDDLVNPIMIKRSAPYQVFARKPATGTKRKRDTSSEEESNVIGKFQDGLDQLFQDAKRMKKEDKKRAMDLICSKMFELDSAFFVTKFNQLQNNNPQQQ